MLADRTSLRGTGRSAHRPDPEVIPHARVMQVVHSGRKDGGKQVELHRCLPHRLAVTHTSKVQQRRIELSTWGAGKGGGGTWPAPGFHPRGHCADQMIRIVREGPWVTSTLSAGRS